MAPKSSPNSITIAGFRFAGVRCGLKESGKRDVGLIASDGPATAAATFTTNRIKAAPVLVGMERAPKGVLQAIIVNSGNANAYTGADGLAVANRMCALVAGELKVDEELVIPSSTGRIGVQMPRRLIERGVREACRSLRPNGFAHALEAIMTTDAFPKFAVADLKIDSKQVRIVAMAKGAGMIAPKLRVAQRPPHATTLAYVLTDAAVSAAALRKILGVAQKESFNKIVVDGDTSTNDTIAILANGAAGNRRITTRSRDLAAFTAAASEVLEQVARMIVEDGEGATKVVDIYVRGARSEREAALVADSIARSPLCKTAFYGGDPATGRILCATGYSGAIFDPGKIDILIGGIKVVRKGIEILPSVEKQVAKVMQAANFDLTVDLHAGPAVAHRITSDLSVDYVKFNSDYRT